MMFGALFHKVGDPVTKDVVRAGCRNIIPPHNYTFGNLVSRVIMSLRKPLATVKNTVIANNGFSGCNPGGVAAVPAHGK